MNCKIEIIFDSVPNNEITIGLFLLNRKPVPGSDETGTGLFWTQEMLQNLLWLRLPLFIPISLTIFKLFFVEQAFLQKKPIVIYKLVGFAIHTTTFLSPRLLVPTYSTLGWGSIYSHNSYSHPNNHFVFTKQHEQLILKH